MIGEWYEWLIISKLLTFAYNFIIGLLGVCYYNDSLVLFLCK